MRGNWSSNSINASRPSAVSHQLRTLRDWRLVRWRREGRHIFYTLDDEHVADLCRQGLEHVTHAGELRGSDCLRRNVAFANSAEANPACPAVQTSISFFEGIGHRAAENPVQEYGEQPLTEKT